MIKKVQFILSKNFRGVCNIDGLYFIGLPWMYNRGSATLDGVSKEATYLANIISNKEQI
jgi:putative flavoprotein involved in K+ transport